jgi:hypothetical protein
MRAILQLGGARNGLRSAPLIPHSKRTKFWCGAIARVTAGMIPARTCA